VCVLALKPSDFCSVRVSTTGLPAISLPLTWSKDNLPKYTIILIHVEILFLRNENETIVTDNFTGVRCRVIKNKFSDNLVELSKNNTSPWEIMQSGVGKIREAYVEGDVEWGSLTFGQICGLIDDIPTCKNLIESIVQEAEKIMESMQKKILAV